MHDYTHQIITGWPMGNPSENRPNRSIHRPRPASRHGGGGIRNCCLGFPRYEEHVLVMARSHGPPASKYRPRATSFALRGACDYASNGKLLITRLADCADVKRLRPLDVVAGMR